MNFETYLKHIHQTVLILDALNQVVHVNLACHGLFPLIQRGEHIYPYLDTYPELIPFLSYPRGNYQLRHEQKVYSVHLSYIMNKSHKRIIARCLLLSDVTEIVKLLESIKTANENLEKKNTEVMCVNRRKKHRLEIEKKSAAINEKKQILRDIHDTLGHTFTKIHALLNLAFHTLSDVDRCRSYLDDAYQLSQVSMSELITSDITYDEGGITGFLHHFANSMSAVHLHVELKLCGQELPFHRILYIPIMRICQESATNCIRHGHATMMNLSVIFSEDKVLLEISNNGDVPVQLNKGNGLSGMESRVLELSGTIDFICSAADGFKVKIQLPVQQKKDPYY